MTNPTPEQIAEAKAAIRSADRHGACHVILHDAEIILAALEAVQKERDSLATYAAKLEKAGDKLRGNLKDETGALFLAIFAWDVARKEKPCVYNL